MNKVSLSAAVLALTLALGGCASGPHGQEVGIAGGAITGGAIGAAVSRGNPVAAVGGAVVGGLIGNQIGREYDYRHGRYHHHRYSH
jgi:osmotically inducible lipoprotein OsmB